MSDRLRQLADDWDHYGATIEDRAWADEMRRTIIMELEMEVKRLGRLCADTPLPSTPHMPAHKTKLAGRVRRMMRSQQ